MLLDVFYFSFFFFFFNDTATTEIYTLSLHDALPIYSWVRVAYLADVPTGTALPTPAPTVDRKSTRLNSSHVEISYAVFCLKKKKKKKIRKHKIKTQKKKKQKKKKKKKK